MSFLRFLLRLLSDESGEISNEQSGQGENSSATSAAEESSESSASEAGEESGSSAAEGAVEEKPFYQLPDNLKDLTQDKLVDHFKRMQRIYTKDRQSRRDLEQKASVLDRYYGNLDFRRQTYLELVKEFGEAEKQEEASTGNTPPKFEELIRKNLPSELKWMAESLAASVWAANQSILEPLQKEQKTKRLEDRSAQFDGLADDLSQEIPGWEDHEDEMSALLDFFQSDQMSHRKYGSKLRLLYNIVTGNNLAISEAVKRMGQAARNRTVSGQSNRTTTSNVNDRIKNAKSRDEKWQIAAEAAINDLKRNGIPVR